MIVAGVGFATAADAADIIRAILAALEHHDLGKGAVGLLASIEHKRDSTALADAADQLDVPLIFIERTTAEAVSEHLLTRSERSIAATGLPSVCEAAALGAAGKAGRLLGARLITGGVACALAQSAADPGKTMPTSGTTEP